MGLLTASQPDARRFALALPVAPGTEEERDVADRLLAELRTRGHAARTVGTVGDAPEAWIEVVHLGVGALAVAVGCLGPLLPYGQALAAFALVSALFRRYGIELLGAFVPRVPTWTVIAGDPAGARLLEVIPLDRARPRDPRLVTGALLVATGTLIGAASIGVVPRLVAAALVIALAVARARREVVVPDPESVEARRVRERLATLSPGDGRLVIFAGASARAWGAAEGALDWLGVGVGSIPVRRLDGRTPRGRAWLRRGWKPAPEPTETR